MKIIVAQEDILNGIRMRCNACPITLAIKRKIGRNPNMGGVGVGYDQIAIDEIYYSTSSKVKSFIHSFDLGQAVTPFEFELRSRNCMIGKIYRA